MVTQVEKYGFKQKKTTYTALKWENTIYLSSFKFLSDYSRKGIRMKSDALNTVTFALVISVEQCNQPVVELITDML